MGNSTHLGTPSEALVYINASFSALIAAVALPANLIIIFIFLRFKKLRDMNNTAVTILSLSDLLRVTVVMTVKLHNQLLFVSHLDTSICTLTALVCGFTFVFSPLILALIAIVRYCKIVPWTSRSIELTYGKFYGAVFAILLVAIIFALLPVFGVGHYAYSQSHGVCFTDWSDENKTFRTIFYLLVIGLAFPVLIISYSSLFFALHKHNKSFSMRMATGYTPSVKPSDAKASKKNECYENDENKTSDHHTKPVNADSSERRISMQAIFKELSKTTKSKISSDNCDLRKKGCLAENEIAIISKGHNKSREESSTSSETPTCNHRMVKHIYQRELQLTKVMMVICLAYCVCWLPAGLVNVIALSHLEKIPMIYFYVIVTMVELKCALNPIIYGLGNRKYREKLKSILRVYTKRLSFN